MRTVVMPPACDLVRLTHSYGGAVKGLTFTLKVIKAVPTPRDFATVTGHGCQWVQCGILWVQLNHIKARQYCKNVSLQSYLNSLPEYMLGYGCIYICTRDNEVVQGDTVRVPYITVSDANLSAAKRSPAVLYLNRWDKNELGWSAVGGNISALSIPRSQDSLQVLFENFVKLSMNTLVNNIKLFDAEKLIMAGSTTVTSVPPVAELPVETIVEVDDENTIIARHKEDEPEAVQMSLLPQEGDYVVFGESHTGITVRNGRSYYNRDSFYDNPAFISGLVQLLQTSEKKVNQQLVPLADYASYDISQLKDVICTNIASYYTRKPSDGFGMTGRTLFKNVMTKAMENGIWSDVSESEVRGYASAHNIDLPFNNISVDVTDAEYLLSIFQDDYAQTIKFLDKWQQGDVMQVADEFKPFFIRENRLVWLFIAEILKLKYKFEPLIDYRGTLYTLISQNPYNLIYYSSSISILDMDKIAMLMGVFNKPELEAARCVAFIHSVMVDEDNSVVNCRTCVPKQEILTRLKYGYTVPATMQKQLLMNSGYAIERNMLINVTTYLGVSEKNFVLTQTEFEKSGTKTVYLRSVDMRQAVASYIQAGLGVEYEGCLIDYTMLQREVGIYQMCKGLCERDALCELSETDKQRVISEFEQSKQAVLEEKQKKVFDLQGNAVAVTGSAGTGKTFVAEAIIKYEKARGRTEDEIILIAPTGGAANRLRSLTGHKANTIHSFLHLGISREQSLMDESQHNFQQVSPKVVIVDESSMITLDLMYTLFSCLDLLTVNIYFLGDVAQLPPIGFGKPFMNMLKYLPCVTLEVSKRASSESMITRNANAFLDVESGAEIVNGTDFNLIQADNLSVQQEIVKICNHHLGVDKVQGLPDIFTDDIQVVTPVKRENYAWGCGQLNTLLRGIFNPNYAQQDCIQFAQGDSTAAYYVGDKVVNLKNHSFMRRYEEIMSDTFEMLSEMGITNGDIGKIVKIVDGSKVTFMTDYGLPDRKRTAIQNSRKEYIYIFVEYKSINVETKMETRYLISYAAKKLNGNFVNAVDLSEIELAYAITTHKMQGSQAAVVIAPLFNIGFASDFISNNMVYTGMTRAQKHCYMVGDVIGNFSALEKARKTLVLAKKLSIFDKY